MKKIFTLCLLLSCFVGMEATAAKTTAANVPIVPSEMFDKGGKFHRHEILQPTVDVDSKGHIYVAWAAQRRKHVDIYLSKSIDGGKSFLEPVQVNDHNGSAGVGWQFGPQLAIDASDRLYVSYCDFRKPFGIYLAISTDGGKTFDPAIRVTDVKLRVREIMHAMSVGKDGRVYISWLDDGREVIEGHHYYMQVYFTRSLDGGKHFEKPTNITTMQKNPVCECCRVSMTVAGDGTVIVTYRNNREGIRDIYLSASRDDGQSWSEPIRVGFGNWEIHGCPADAPVLATDANELHVAWMDARNGTRHVYYNSSPIAELRFRQETEKPVNRSPIRLGNPNKPKYGEGGHPSIAIDSGGHLTIAWEAAANSVDIHAVTLELNADTRKFSKEQRVNSDLNDSHQGYPVLTSHGARTYAVWMDSREGHPRAYFAELK